VGVEKTHCFPIEDQGDGLDGRPFGSSGEHDSSGTPSMTFLFCREISAIVGRFQGLWVAAARFGQSLENTVWFNDTSETTGEGAL